MIYDSLIDTTEQLMSQRQRIVSPGVSSRDTLQAYICLTVYADPNILSYREQKYA